jgi:hypothetical protein
MKGKIILHVQYSSTTIPLSDGYGINNESLEKEILKHYQKNKNVQTIMLEINRALYSKELDNEKTEGYSEIKRVVGEFIRVIHKLEVI